MELEQDWIQFKAAVNGDSIPVPEMYREQCRGDMNIIAFRSPNREDTEWKDKKPFVAPFLFPTKGFKFNREEANER
ncbi:MAG: hypothetical protein FWE98_07645 [Oscillospiraceae bacterium]|nr:hypothetical protein [Oscillospiraceae bacterium]